jgi:hypothetical protein
MQSWVLVAHSCNPSYSGGRNQEDRGTKPAQAIISARPCLKKPFTKTGLVEWLKVKALNSNPSTEKKRNKYTNICLGKSHRINTLSTCIKK